MVLAPCGGWGYRDESQHANLPGVHSRLEGDTCKQMNNHVHRRYVRARGEEQTVFIVGLEEIVTKGGGELYERAPGSNIPSGSTVEDLSKPCTIGSGSGSH